MSPWTSEFCYQMRPTVIRHPQTTQAALNSIDSPSYYSQFTHNSQQSALPWSRCDVTKEQLSNNYSSLYHKSLLPSQNTSLYSQQVAYHHYTTAAETGGRPANSQSQWFNHMTTTRDVNRDVISDGVHSWRNSNAWNRSVPLRCENDIKQSNFQFNPCATFNVPAYTSLATHF